MEELRNEHRRMEKQRNEAVEKLRREQADLNQQLAAANRKVQEISNRPGKFEFIRDRTTVKPLDNFII